MIARAHITSGSIQVGQKYGKAVLPNGWEAMLEIDSISDTGDGADYKLVEYTPIVSEHYGAYTGGTATLWTEDNLNQCNFSDVPDYISLSGYVTDEEAEGISGVTVSDGVDSGNSSGSGYWFFQSTTVPYSGTLTPAKTGLIFDPETIVLTNRYWNVADNNFTGTSAAPAKATNPSPADAVTDVTLDQATISWEDGGRADTFDVYYGQDAGSLIKVADAQAETSFTISDIIYGAPFDYQVSRAWRIDAINEYGTTTGDVWTFTTITFVPPPPGIRGYVADEGGYADGNLNIKTRLVGFADNKVYYEDT